MVQPAYTYIGNGSLERIKLSSVFFLFTHTCSFVLKTFGMSEQNIISHIRRENMSENVDFSAWTAHGHDSDVL